MVSSEHEIALCNGRTSKENKKIFFEDLNKFVRKNLRKNASLVFGFPNYQKGASEKEIARQRRLTESLLGHSHPPEEYFTAEETILMANVAVFKIETF